MERSHEVVRTNEVIGVSVENAVKENLGKIEEIVLDKSEGVVRYVVLSFGGIIGMHNKFFAIPWNFINYDPDKKCFILNIEKSVLEKEPGFDKDHWPETAEEWEESVIKFYSKKEE
jgi:sporulation protein YlmC with PRC-barrel domain